MFKSMGLHNHVKEDVTKAMKARDESTLRAARNLLAALTNELVAKKQKPSEMLGDEDALLVIKRLVKQRKDSISQFKTGGREDLVGKEEEEITYLEKYLPETMSRDEIKKVVEAKKQELGVTNKSQMGKFMGAVMSELKGKADGGDVKAVIDELLLS